MRALVAHFLVFTCDHEDYELTNLLTEILHAEDVCYSRSTYNIRTSFCCTKHTHTETAVDSLYPYSSTESSGLLELPLPRTFDDAISTARKYATRTSRPSTLYQRGNAPSIRLQAFMRLFANYAMFAVLFNASVSHSTS